MDEHAPVDEGEFVYRRVPRVFYDSSLPIPIQAAAFGPTTNDTKGISLFRVNFAQPLDNLGNVDPAQAKDYYVARISLRNLAKLGLAVKPDPIAGGPPGHTLIPDLSAIAYQANKQSLKAITAELAKLASADIVHEAT